MEPAQDAPVNEVVEATDVPAAAELVDPGEFLSGWVNLIARAPDRLSTQMVFEIASSGSEDWRALGTARAPFHLPVDTRPLVDGVYELRVELLSAGGQSAYSRSHGPHIVDNTPPTVEIVQPLEGDELRDWVELVANAADETSGVARVALSYSEGGEWRSLAELEPEDGEVRGFWQTEDCHPGRCQLRATAYDRAGNGASHIIAVTIAATPLEPEPARSATSGSEPEGVQVRSARPSSQASARFGAVPNWEWERLAPKPPEEAEQVGVEAQERLEPTVEPVSQPIAAAERPTKTSIAWSWKAPALESEQTLEKTREPETKPDSTSAQQRGDVPQQPRRAIRLAEPLQVEDAGNEEQGKTEGGSEEARDKEKPDQTGAAPPQGGRLVSFPRAARGWDIWELGDLVDETPRQDPMREEERRQILYYLREYSTMGGRIPPEFEDLIYETFGDLMPVDSPA
ncbi:MAG: hypothetical protein ABSC51_08025 [Gaiellaceae bacterium]